MFWWNAARVWTSIGTRFRRAYGCPAPGAVNPMAGGLERLPPICWSCVIGLTQRA